MKIVVSTFFYPNYTGLAGKTTVTHLNYSNKNGYLYKVNKIEYPVKFKGGYEALCIAGKENARIVDEILNSAYLHHGPPDYLFTIGCDAIITNMDRKLEEIIREYPFDIVTGSDKAGINTSQMLIKNTEQSRSYFKHMLKAIENGCEHDQRYMWDNPKDFICPAPQWVMNSYDTVTRLEGEYDAGNWQAGDFLVHLAGMTLEQRMGVVDKWLSKVKGA
jgi:hypothetical protein